LGTAEGKELPLVGAIGVDPSQVKRWIEKGDNPLPRRPIMTTKSSPPKTRTASSSKISPTSFAVGARLRDVPSHHAPDKANEPGDESCRRTD
jgi:hypothetical protein